MTGVAENSRTGAAVTAGLGEIVVSESSSAAGVEVEIMSSASFVVASVGVLSVCAVVVVVVVVVVVGSVGTSATGICTGRTPAPWPGAGPAPATSALWWWRQHWTSP